MSVTGGMPIMEELAVVCIYATKFLLNVACVKWKLAGIQIIMVREVCIFDAYYESVKSF
jgi:hypothetical protein